MKRPARRRGEAASTPRALGETFRRELGGAPANVATSLARLGIKAGLVGGIGQDLFGEALAAHLARDGVDTRSLVRLPNRTGLAFVTNDPLGEPAFLFYRDRTADVSLRAEHLRPAMANASWVLVGSSTSMTPPLAAATDRFLTLAAEAGAHVVVDLNVREHLWADRAEMRRAVASLVRAAAVVKGSMADLMAVSGRRDLRWLADHAPDATWVLTRGANGASAMGDHGFVAEASHPVPCVDATGAGDAFLAGLLAVLVAAKAVPSSPVWREPALWSAALEAGHLLGAQAVSAIGAVRGVRDVAPVREVLARAAALASRSTSANPPADRTRAASKGAAPKRVASKTGRRPSR